MAIRTAKAARSKAAKPQAAAVPSEAGSAPAASSLISGSKPNSLHRSSLTPVTADMRRAMIAEAAYYIAEQRGFAQGGEVEDWLLAEKQVDTTLSA